MCSLEASSFTNGCITSHERDNISQAVAAGSLIWMYQTVSNALLAPSLAAQECLAIMAHQYSDLFTQNFTGVQQDKRVELIEIFNRIHIAITPKTWPEIIVKQIIGDVIIPQFYPIPEESDAERRAKDFFIGELGREILQDKTLTQTLRLYLRRIKSEMVTGAQYVIAEIREYDSPESDDDIALVNDIAHMVDGINELFEERQQVILAQLD